MRVGNKSWKISQNLCIFRTDQKIKNIAQNINIAIEKKIGIIDQVTSIIFQSFGVIFQKKDLNSAIKSKISEIQKGIK